MVDNLYSKEHENVIPKEGTRTFEKANRKIIIFITILILIIGIYGINKMTGNITNSETKVKLETNYGKIIIQLYEKEMPVTSGNFRKLVQQGFYNGVIFHRVIDRFMIQGGDPTGTGMGGPGYEIKDEFTNSNLDENNRGTIAMANAGPNTGGSQFFINLANNDFLNRKHPVFGKVIEGMNIVDKIAKVSTDSQDKPLENVVIKKASLI